MKYTLTVICLLLMIGCGPLQQPTFLQLEMYGEDEAALYIVTNEGKILYGGGMDALVGETNWHGQLSDQQFTELTSIITHSDLESNKEQLQQRFVIRLQDENPIEVSLKNATAVNLYESLKGMTSDRYSDILNILPRPTTKIIIDRSVEGERYKKTTDQAAHQSE